MPMFQATPSIQIDPTHGAQLPDRIRWQRPLGKVRRREGVQVHVLLHLYDVGLRGDRVLEPRLHRRWRRFGPRLIDPEVVRLRILVVIG